MSEQRPAPRRGRQPAVQGDDVGVFARRLRAARETRGLNQEEAARLAGLKTVRMVSHYEAGTPPSFEAASALAEALGFNLGELQQEAARQMRERNSTTERPL